MAQETHRCQRGDDCQIVVIAGALTDVIATTKTNTPIIESPQSISVVNRAEIDLRAAQTVADALSYTAGVQAQPTGVDSRVDEVSVRGFGAGGFASNNNFIDGLRIPAGGEGTWLRPAFDAFALDRIDVLKGPSGALYGQSAPGGVVNLVTKRPSFSSQGEILLQGAGYTNLGDWSWQAGADFTGPLNGEGTLAGRIVGLAHHGDTQIDGVTTGRYYVSPSLTWEPGESTRWTVIGQYQRDEGGSTFQFLPSLGTLYPSDGRVLDKSAFLGEPDWNQYDRNQYLIASFFEQDLGSQFTLRNNSRYSHLDTIYRGVVPAGNTLTTCPETIPGCIAGRTLNRRAVQGNGKTNGIATDTQIEARFATGAIEHILLGGFDFFRAEWEHTYNLVNGALVLPILDIFNPKPRGTGGFADNMRAVIDTETVSRQTGLYLQDQISVGRLRLTIGGRQDWAKDRSYNPQTGGRLTTTSDAFTWRAGAVWLFDNGLAPYASYSESFQPMVSNRDPASSQVEGGVPFVPTTGQQYEVGLRYQQGDSIYVTLSAYQITQQNITTPDPEGTLCGISVCLVQTGEGRVRGAELEGKASLPWGMTVIGTATRSDSEVTESNTVSEIGNTLSQLPEWMASLFVDQSFTSGALAGLGLGGGVRYTGESYGDTANTLAIPDYALFDMLVRYDFGVTNERLSGLSLSLNARNLADKHYIASCISPGCYIGQGRVVTARLQFRW
ncbi:TonB-dependent siderophore receptor [Altererythrobacter endophyticus]|uniref:TonB-dependent siderophore receptor n=2 Tax=Altericroceibacterium endophyticum TaxID=1808508 RepID=A0A6I4T4S4_9SPHN|nr:TonB-dependent siderophore receptor [Altericroceibacterium endophyticum]